MKIMLLTDIPPCMNFTAGIVLNKMCDFLLDAGHEVCCFAVKDVSVDAIIPTDKVERMRFQIVKKPVEGWGHLRLGPLASFIGNQYTAAFVLPGIARQAGDFAGENRAELIWSVVQGQTMIKLTEPAARRAGLPYVIQVWDPPEWWLMENRFDRFSTRSVMRSFQRALHHSRCCLAASWAMADYYSRQYDCRSIPVVLGFEPGEVCEKKRREDDSLVIALSGQLYASQEIQALIQALDLMDWQYNGRKIVLRFYGKAIRLFLFRPSNIQVMGWLPQDELLSELAQTDLLYCPYWFSEQFRLPAALSFPSKLSTYLKTGVPTLVHAPEYASPRQFVEQNDVGYICGTLDPNTIRDVLHYIFGGTEEERRERGARGYRAFLDHLTTGHMRAAFFEGLGIAAEQDGAL